MVRGPKTALSPDSLGVPREPRLAGRGARSGRARDERDASVDDAGVSGPGGADAGAGRGRRGEERAGGRDVHGYSAICIARGLAEGGTLTCLELDDEYADIAQRNLEAAGVEDRVDIVRGPAGASLDAMPEEPMFDFVFLDADKTGYPDYYEQILPRMNPNALLLIDNILMGGDVVDPEPGTSNEVVAAAQREDRQDDRVDAAFAMVADGVAFVRKR